MDEKKLAALHAYMLSKGDKIEDIGDEKTFINDMKNEENFKVLHSHLAETDDYFGKDFNKFKSAYLAPEQPQTVVGDFMQSAQDLAATALQEKAKSDARNEQIAGDIKSEQVRQKPKDYYTQNIPQVHAEFKQGEPQNLQAVMSPNNPKLSGDVLFEKEKIGAYESATDNREAANLVERNPKIIEQPKTEIQEIATPKYPSDVIGLGMKQRDERIKETAWLLKNAITGNQDEDNWTGDMGITANLNQLDPEKVTDVGADALKWAQSNKIPYEIATAIKDGDDKVVADYLRVHDDEFAKKVYNEGDRVQFAQLANLNPRDVTPNQRLNFWHEKTKGLSKLDMPETLPYQLVANDSKTLKEQLDLIGNLFEEKTGAQPETTEQAVAAMPKSFAQEFPNPNEQIYAYYQVLASRFQELTRELAKEYPIGTQEQKLSLKEDTEGLKSLIGTRLAFVGVDDLKDPKWVEYMRVLNKIHALAPLVQKGQAGKAEGEWGDEPIYGGDIGVNALLYAKSGVGKIAASMWSGVGDMLGYDVLKTNQENIAREQQNALAQTGGQITPKQQKVLDEKQDMSGFFNPKSWGAQGASLVGMGVIMSSNPFAGQLQSAGKGLQMLNKGSKLFNSEQKLTRLGKVVQGAVGLTAAGLETEIAGQVSGEGESVTDELSFGMGVAGEAGKLALGAVIGLVGKRATKITPKALVAQVEKQYGKLSPAAQKAVENYGTNISNRVGNAFGKELPEEVFQTGYENYKKHGLDGMMSATIRDIMGEDRDWNTAMRWVAQIALMGALDGQPDTDNYKLQTWAVTMAEKFSGQKVNVDLVNEFVDKMRKETENAPTGVKFKDNGVDFTLNNTQFSYTDGKIQAVGGKSVDAELQNKAAEVGAKMTDGYQAAVQNGDFNPLFGIDVANKTKEELDAARAEQGGQSVRFDNTDENTNLQSNEAQQNPTVSEQEKALETQTNEIVAPTAEELDVRRAEIATRQGEIEPQLRAAKIEAEDLKKQLKADYSDEIADKLDEKRLEIDVLEKEGLDLADEDTNIASQRETTLTEKETIDKRKAEIKVKTEENSANIEQLQAQYESAVDEGNRDLMKSLSAEKAALVAENESLAKEIESLQPKEESVKNAQSNEKTDIQKSLSEDPTLQRGVLINHESEKTKEELMEIVEKLRNGSLSRQEVINLFPNLAVNTLGEVKQFFDDNTLADKIQFGLDVKAKEQVSKRSKAQIEKSKQAVLNNKKQSEKALAESEYKTVVKKDGLTGEKTETKVRRTAEEREKYENYHKGIINEANKSIKEYDSELAKLEKEAAEEISATEKTGSKENGITETPIAENQVSSKKEPTEKPITETPQAEKKVVEKEESLQNMTTSEESVTESKGEISPTPETKVEKEAETPVAPAAPKEEDNKPEKGKSKKEQLRERQTKKLGKDLIPPNPQTPKQETRTINKKEDFADFLYEMSEQTPEDRMMADYTAEVYNETAKAWAKREGKTVQDWWSRIESITIGGENTGNGLNQEGVLNDLNPTGGVFVNYAPQEIDKMPLGENIVTYDKTSGKNPSDKVTVYRGVPKSGAKIVSGDFVTTNKQLAKDYAGSGTVISMEVRADEILDDKTEPLGEEYILRLKNNSLQQGAQGSIQKTADGRFKLFLLANRDVSTPLHELSHIFQNDLSNAEKAKVVQWINKQFGEKFTPSQLVWEGGTDKALTPEARKISEFFARGFEQYLKEGKQLKDKAMQTIFDKFSEWLKGVYETAIQYMGKDIVLNDDMRKIYAEMAGQDQVFAQKIEKQKPSLVDEEATDPEQLVWNYFAKEGQINKQDVIDRFAAKNRGVVPAEKMKHINNSAYISETAKTKQQIAKDLFDSQTGEKEYDDIDYFKAVDAVVDEMGAGFSKVVTAKIKEYAANKNKTDDEEAINAQAEDIIEQVRKNRANKPNADEMLRMQYEKEIDEAIFGGSSLNQTANNIKAIENELISTAVIDRTADEETIEAQREIFEEDLNEYNENLPLESRFTAEEMRGIVDRAIYKVTAPLDAETTLSEHADKIEGKRNEIIEKERQSLPQDTIDALREEVKKIAETITDSTTQEEVAQMQSETKDMLISKGMSQKDAQELVNEFIRERSFGTKFRDNYAPQMSQELRDAVMKQTYFYRVVSNSAAIQKAEAKINEWYEKAIENVAQKWHDNGQKPDATNQDFIADTYEELMDLVNDALFNQKITADYYVKVAAAMYAIKLADTLVGNLTAKAKTRVLDKTVTLVNNLAELGNFLGRSINMFGVMANVSGGVLQAIFKKEMSNIIANMSFSQKVNKDAIEAVLDGVADMVQGIKDGTNKGLIQSLVDAMENNASVEKLLEKIVENATNEQDIIDILNKIDDLEIQKEALKKEIKDKLELEAKIREKNKEIAQLRAALAAKKPTTGTTNKNTQRQKTAAKTKYDSLIDEVVSFGQNLFSNSLYQTIEGFQSTMFATYKPEVITKVNDIMKNITDFVYLGNENVSAERLYEMVQSAAKKEFAQKYLEKANIQPDVPLNTGSNLTKAQEVANKTAIAKNKEKQNQKQLHQDILDAINNDKFKASIETYIQENQAKDIRAQMRKRVTGIVNDTNATAAEKKVELRKALVQMVGEAATSTNEAAKGIKDFMRTYFDVTGKDVTAFEAEFDKMWAAQVEKKQLDLIKKRLQTSAEKDEALTEKVINDLIKHFETNKEFGHKFSEDLAKNIRITEKNWTDETAKRFRDTYHIPISMAHNQKKIADMIKYIDTLPNGTDAKEMAMNVVMNEYLNIVGVSNLDRWVALVDVMFHVNNLLNLPTIWQNIKDSLYQVAHDMMLPVANFFGEVITAMVDKDNFRTALNKAQKGNRLNAKVVFKTLFSQSTRRLAQNQFSLQEARAVGEYASFMDYFAKSFSELPSKLKNFKFNSVGDFIQYGIPAGLMFAYDSARLGKITNALMSGPDLALGNALQMGRMANILSRKGIDSKEAMELADISTAGDRELDYGGKMQKISDILTSEREKGYFANQEAILKVWNDAIASGKTEEQAHNAIKQAVADGTITSDYKREWRRKMELFAEYVEQEHAAWIIADTYRRNATYKTDPTGLLGMAYQGITTWLIRGTRQNEMEARERYNRNKTPFNLAKQKLWQQAKLFTERVLGLTYFRTKINLANKYLLNFFLTNLATHIKNNVGYMDTDAAMKLSVNDKGEITPNSLWYIDDLTNKGFLKEAENKLQADIDKINESATEKKEAITEKENDQIEKIDNTISDKEKILKERKAAIDKVSDKKQESIDKKIDKRKEIIDTFTKRIQGINDLFSEKEQKILDSIAAAIAKIESKILDIEIKAVDKVSAKNAKIETKITQYVRKREQLYAQSLLIDRKIESETSDFESMLLELNEQEKAISEKLGNDEKIVFSDFVNKKRQELADLHGKKVAELNKKKAIKSAQIAEAITLFEFQLENYKNIYESSIDYIQRDVQRFVETAENNIKKVAASEDSKIQENSDKRDEAVQKVKDTQKQRVAALDHELNVAINVEKEKYNRQKAYLDGVFAKEKAQLESEKSVIARKAEADRKNINNLAAAKAKPIITEKDKIANKIASYDANYRIGYADEKARQVRIGVTTALLLASYLFSSGDDDDEEKPMIEVVGDITGADGGTKASNQNSKEANSKKKLIIRAFGQQLSFNFMDKANVMELLVWGEIFDHLARKKRGVVSDKSIVDVAARPMLTFIQQIFAFRDASTLDFTNPFKEPSENVLKAASNVSPVKMPAQVRQIIGDFIYNGQQYDLPDNETYFKQYLRLLGVHPEALSTENAKYAVRYSMVNGQPLHQYSGDNSNEINRLIATGIWGKETSTSFNDYTIKPDKANVLFKEMEFLSWLHDRGLTSAINITNPDDTAPKVVNNILLGTSPMPVDEFQKNILNPTAVQASDKLREMYKSGKYGTKNSEGYYVAKTEKDIILSVKNLKSGEEAAKDYLESNKTDLAALNIGLKYITKDLWENTKKEVLMKYLKEKKPNYKRPGETYTTYKNRVKLK